MRGTITAAAALTPSDVDASMTTLILVSDERLTFIHSTSGRNACEYLCDLFLLKKESLFDRVVNILIGNQVLTAVASTVLTKKGLESITTSPSHIMSSRAEN